MLWWNDLGIESCSQSSVSLTAGTGPEQFLGRRVLKREIQGRTNPDNFPVQKKVPGRDGHVLQQLCWMVWRPAHLWGRVIKKMQSEAEAAGYKAAGGRMESMNKSASYILCFRNSTLTQPYLFHKGSTKRDSISLSFSPLTQSILGTLITS